MVKVSPIRTEEDYRKALKELSRVFHAEEGTQDYELMDVLSVLVGDYEDLHYPIPEPDPIEVIKFKMEQEGMTQRDLAKIVGYDSRVSEILNRKRKLTLPMIRKLSSSLNIALSTLIQDYELAN